MQNTFARKKQARNENLTGDTVVRFTVYGEPVPKGRPRFGQGRVHTPERTRIHEEKIMLVYKSYYHGFSFKKGIPLILSADFFMKIPKSDKKAVREAKLGGELRPTKVPDADNLLKCVADGLKGAAYQDDNQIVEWIGRKYWSDEPRTEIFLARVGRSGDDEETSCA